MNKFKGLLVSITPLSAIATVLFLFYSLFPPVPIEGIPSLNFVIAIVLLTWILISLSSKKSYAVPIPILLLAGFMLLSAFWSQNAMQTINNSLLYLLLLASAISLASEHTFVRAGLSIGLFILAAWSFIALFFEEEGPIFSVLTRDFSGIYSNHNGFAFVLITAFPALLSLQITDIRIRYLKAISVIGVSFLVVISGSETELGALIVTFIVWGMIRFQKHLRVIWIATVPLIALVILVLMVLVPDLLRIIGKDPTMAGRTTLWLEVASFIQQSPVIGMGWTNSWPDNSALFARLLEIGMPLHHAHNEILNWMLTLGIIGLLFVLWIYGSMIVGGVKLLNSGEKGLGIWVTLTAVAFFVRGLSEISETNALGWFIWVLAYVSMMNALWSNGVNRLTFPIQPRF